MALFRDRRDAGRKLVAELVKYKGRSDVVVLALPHGGVPVAFEIAKGLGAPLDVLVVQKLTVPGQENFGLGAVASGGAQIVNEGMVQSLGVSKETVEALIIEAQREITRLEREYRGYHPNLDIRDKTVILVDDGIATGSTVRAALRAVRQLKPARLVVAVPTTNPYIQAEVEGSVNEFISLAVPEPYLRVGLRYQHFPKVDSDEVRELLDEAGRHYLKVARDRHAP